MIFLNRRIEKTDEPLVDDGLPQHLSALKITDPHHYLMCVMTTTIDQLRNTISTQLPQRRIG